MSRFPSLHSIATESRSSRGRGFLTSEQVAAQDEIQAEFRDFNAPGICLPWYEKRDLTATGGTNGSEGGNTISTDVPEIGSALRSKLVLEQLGTRIFAGLRSNVRFPRAKAEITAEWLSETAQAAESSFTFGALSLAPKRVTAWLDVSRQLLEQGEAIEPFLRAELMGALAEEIQRVIIGGTGTSNQPLGILNTANIGSVAGGTNGAAPTNDHISALEYAVTGTGKADRGRTGWLVSPLVRRKLRRTEMFTGGGSPIWPNTEAARLLGHPAGVTTSIPDNLEKGGSGAVCSAIVFAEFTELIMCLWGAGVYVSVNPHAGDALGWVRLVASSYIDGGLRSPEAAAAMKDALCA